MAASNDAAWPVPVEARRNVATTPRPRRCCGVKLLSWTLVREMLHHSARLNDVEIATEAAKAGAEILLRYWETIGKADADMKARNDWVSAADREAEKAIIACIRDLSPGDSFLAEETGASGEKSNRTWVIDPLDG